MEILEIKEKETERYGIIRLVKTDKGWAYQYDQVLVDGCSHDDGFGRLFLEKGEEPYGEYIPEYLEDLDDDFFCETEEEALTDCLDDLSNQAHMGTIATW